MRAARRLCHCMGNLRSGEWVLANVAQLLTAQVCLTSQPETPPAFCSLSSGLRPNSRERLPLPQLTAALSRDLCFFT